MIRSTITGICLFLSLTGIAQIDFSKAEGNEKGAALEYSPDGNLLLSGGNNNIGSWVTSTNILSKSNTVKGINGISELAFLNNDTVYLSGNDDDIFMYGIKEHKIAAKLKGHDKRITAIIIDQGTRKMFSASMDKTTILWNLDSNVISKRFKDHKDFVLGVALDPRNGKMASCGADGVLNLYDRDGKLLFTNKITKKWLWSLSFSHDGKHIIIGGQDEIYFVTNLDNPIPQVTAIEDINGNAINVKFSPDSKYVGVGTTDQTVYLFETSSHKLLLKKKSAPGCGNRPRI